MKSHARVVVIGGGVFGCSLLYHLVKRGWSDVALVEKNELTAGSTWHAAGLCTHFAHHLSIMRMRAYSVALYKRLESEVGQPTGFKPTGALRITRQPDRIDEFRHVAAMGRWIDCDFEIIGPERLAELHPLARAEGVLGGIWEPKDGNVDPSQATNAMARGARDGGAAIHRHTPVEAIRRAANGEWLVETRDGAIRCEIVVNAGGTWAREIGAMMGLDLPVAPMLHQYLVTDRVPEIAELERPLPILRDPEESWYVRQERDGAVIGVYERDGVPWAVDGVPPDFGMDLLPPDLDRVEPIIECALARVPALATAGIKTVVNGPITFTPDANPLIGPAPGLRNAFLMTGTSMGVMEGGGAGWMLADWIVDGEPPCDLFLVDPRRFGAYADRDFRIDKAVECFAHQFAIHYPFEERPAGRPRKTSPIHGRLAAKGAVFGAAYGWERANWFAPAGAAPEATLTWRRASWFDAVGEECRAARQRAAVIDLSGFAKFEASGPGAAGFLDRLIANRLPSKDGRIALAHCLTPRGGIECEFTVTRLAANRFYLVSAVVAERHDRDWLMRHAPDGGSVAIANVTEDRGVLVLAGPRARDVLATLTNDDVSNQAHPWLTARDITVAGVEVRALRVNFVGELGWELHVPVAGQAAVYDALMAAGAAHGIVDAGFFAVDSLRLEKAYRAWGADLTVDASPLAAGLGRFVAFDKGDFIGRDALLAERAAGPRDTLVCLTIAAADADAVGNEPVLAGGRAVGIVTSGGYGHAVGASLALAYVETPFAAPGTRLAVEILGDARPATVTDGPLWDPGNVRPRA